MSRELLSIVIKNLKAPKSQYNKFGKYHYRNVEDIQEGLKKVLPEGCYCNCSDEVILIGDRFYVKSIATFHGLDGFKESAIGLAREPVTKKGMDESQITGTASSYARKIAMTGLFQLDDNKDADSVEKVENHAHSLLSDGQIKRLYAIIAAANKDSDQVISTIKSKANIEHINQLSKDQYDFWCNYIQNAGKKASEQQKLEERPY